MNIVVLDGYTENPGDLRWDGLAALGALTVYDRTDPQDEGLIARRMAGAELVFTNKVPITRAAIDACPQLRFIGVLATGYNIVDCAYAREKGIPVSNVPAYGTAAVSQFSIALLLELCHHIGHHDRVGQAEGRVAKALGMRVLAHDIHPTDAGREIAEYVELDTLYAQADVISLHCNLTPENTGLICRESIEKMKDGVLIVNNARGPLVDEADLAAALNSGKVAGAALDVVSTEPIRADNPLLHAKNCILTPHISWAPKESRQRIMDCTVENAKAFLAGSAVNVVN